MLRFALLLALLVSALPLRAQGPGGTPALPGSLPQTAALAEAGQKEPVVAAVISVVVPGSGHMYAGESGKGWAILGTALGTPFVGGMLGSLVCGDEVSEKGDPECTSGMAIRLTGRVIGLGAWIYGIVDGYSAAKRANEDTAVMERAPARIVLYSVSLP